MAKTNETITLKGEKINVTGSSLSVGDVVPDFTLTAGDMSDVTIQSFSGKILVLCSVPSLDTPVCAVETKRFNQEACVHQRTTRSPNRRLPICD